MKLFVWEDVLEDYTYGIMFALAENVEEARRVIIEKSKKERLDFPKELREVFNMKDDLSKEPKVIEKAEGFYVQGGG